MDNASGIHAARSWPLLGAVLAAIGASSCCILPIVGAVLSVSALGTGGALLGGLRPLFLLAAAVLLFIGGRGVLAARKADACGWEAGAKPSLLPTVMLIVGVVVVVAALAFVPEWIAGAAR